MGNCFSCECCGVCCSRFCLFCVPCCKSKKDSQTQHLISDETSYGATEPREIDQQDIRSLNDALKTENQRLSQEIETLKGSGRDPKHVEYAALQQRASEQDDHIRSLEAQVADLKRKNDDLLSR